jgi:hypothetical protein
MLANGIGVEGDKVMSATDLVQLDGVSEVCKVMSDADIVRMVSTQGTDEADSDHEDAADDFQPCTKTVAQTLKYVQALSEFAMSRPDQSGAEQVNALQDARRALTKLSSTAKKQTSLLGFLAQ